MNPEAAEAIRIADKHLAGETIERRRALALDIQEAIIRHAGNIATEEITRAFQEAQQTQLEQTRKLLGEQRVSVDGDEAKR